jgi:hypothetical protein
LLAEFYPNPVMQPDILSTATSSRDAVDRVFGGEADAAIIPTALKNQYPNLTLVKTSRQYAGQCISCGARRAAGCQRQSPRRIAQARRRRRRIEAAVRTGREQIRGREREGICRRRCRIEAFHHIGREVKYTFAEYPLRDIYCVLERYTRNTARGNLTFIFNSRSGKMVTIASRVR